MSGPFQIAPTNVFSPTQIPGCTIWFDAADSNTVIRSGSTVTSWTSKGSATLTASSVGGGNILYSNYNNNPALYFNGTNTKMTTGTVSSYGTTGTTWLTASVNLTPVVENSTPVDASVVFATLSGSAPEKSIRYNFPPQFIIYTFNNGQIRGGRSNNDNGVRGFIDSGPSMFAYVNGVDITLTQLSATYQPGVNQAFQLGQWNTGWLLGFIQEVLVYDSALSLSQYQLAEGYLAWKWGFQGSLAANHPYKNTPIVSSFPFPSRIPPTIQTLPTVRFLTNDLPFNPRSLTGCGLWLDGADPNGNGILPSNATAISRWIDKSGAGANGIVVGTAATYTSGGGLLFARNGAYNTSYSASLTNESLFIVFRYTTANAQLALVCQTADGGRATTLNAGATTAAFESSVYNVAFGAVSPSTTVPLNTIGLGELVTTNSNMAIFYNGTSFGTPTTVTITAGRTSVVGGAYNAGSPNSAQYFGGIIFEVIGYTVALNTSQRQQVEGYLAWKWGFTASLPNGHPFKTPPLAPFPYAIRSGSQVVFSPLSIAGCSLWLDAKDRGTFTLSGLSITQWADKSGNGRNAVGNTGTGTYSSNGLNSLPTVQITSTGNMRSPVAAGTFPAGILLYVVYQKTGANNSFDTIVTRTTNNIADPIDIWTNNTDTSRLIGRGPGNYWQGYEQTTNVARRTTPTIICMSAFSSTSNIWTETLNGTLSTYILNNNIIGSPSYGDNATQIYIGTRADGATLMNGNISEIIAYSASSMNTFQRQQVEGYLAWKWGLQGSLPATHPYKLFPPK